MKWTLLLLPLFLLSSCDCTRDYRVRIVQGHINYPSTSTIIIRSLDKGYKIGDTIDITGLETQIIVDTVK